MALDTWNPGLMTDNTHKLSKSLLKGISPALGGAADFYGSEVIPGAIGAQRRILSMTSPGGIQAQVSSTRKALLSDAARQAKVLRMRIEGSGGGIGTRQAADVSTTNAANSQANDLLAHYSTPQGQYELFSIINDLSKQFPGLDVTQVLTQLIQWTKQQKQPQDWGGLLQGIGAVAGGFSGGGGGGGSGLMDLSARALGGG